MKRIICACSPAFGRNSSKTTARQRARQAGGKVGSSAKLSGVFVDMTPCLMLFNGRDAGNAAEKKTASLEERYRLRKKRVPSMQTQGSRKDICTQSSSLERGLRQRAGSRADACFQAGFLRRRRRRHGIPVELRRMLRLYFHDEALGRKSARLPSTVSTFCSSSSRSVSFSGRMRQT